MLLNLMNHEQQQLFLDAAVTMAHVDDHLHLNERAFIDEVQRETGGVVHEPSRLGHDDLLTRTSSQFGSSAVAGRAFLMELSGLIVADGEQTDAELQFLRELASAMGAPTSDIPVFLDFALRAIELAEDAQDLLTASNVEA